MRLFLKAVLLGGAFCALPIFAATQTAPASNPDAFITSQTKLSLWTTAGVRSTAVHVDTSEGVVTLYGKVPTADQRALAEKTVLGLGGVRSVRNLLQVVPVKDEVAIARSDKDIRDTVEKQLKADTALKGSQISVKSVDKGVVLLSGEAHTYGEYLRALACVDRVDGVKRIATEVKTPGDYREDERVTFLASPEWSTAKATKTPTDTKMGELKTGASATRITAEVKMRLWTAAQVPSTEISVDTDDGVVSLFGIVPTAEVKAAAGLEAAKVAGVMRVENDLEVVSSATKKAVDAKDTDIARDLALAFKDRPDQKHVTTTVKNGTVRLTGTVANGWDQLETIRMTRRVAGVRGVENDLKVE